MRLPAIPCTVLASVLLALGLAACDAVTSSADGPSAPATADARAAVSTSAVFTWPPETAAPVAGASATLVRTPEGVNYRLSTRDLNPGHAYTLWVVVFNNPAGCDGGFCDPMDLFNEAARPDMVYGVGTVVGASGRATFAGRLRTGDTSGSVQAPIGLFSNGLTDPAGAEVHLVVHDHSPRLAGFMPDMIQTIAGGCTDAGIPEAGAPSPWNSYAGPEYGRSGPNTCASAQFAVLQP